MQSVGRGGEEDNVVIVRPLNGYSIQVYSINGLYYRYWFQWLYALLITITQKNFTGEKIKLSNNIKQQWTTATLWYGELEDNAEQDAEGDNSEDDPDDNEVACGHEWGNMLGTDYK